MIKHSSAVGFRVAATAAVLCCFVVLALATDSNAQDDSIARKMAQVIATKATTNFFKDWSYELDHSGLKGKVKPRDPKDNVKVEIKEFQLLQTSVTLKLAVDAPYTFKGEMKSGDKTVSLKADADVAHTISVRADWREQERKLLITARALHLKLEIKKLEIEPSDLGGVKEKLKTAIAKSESRFFKDLNDWLAKAKIEAE